MISYFEIHPTPQTPFALSLSKCLVSAFPTVLSLSKEALLGNWRDWHFDKLSANGVLCVSLIPRSRLPQY
jgi:hypothetical protein